MDRAGNMLLESTMNVFRTVKSSVLHILRLSHVCQDCGHNFWYYSKTYG